MSAKNAPANCRYTKQHEWVRLEGDSAILGITDFAQEQLTDIVFVELPDVGKKLNVGDVATVLESVKSVADVYSPLAGEVQEVNATLEQSPEHINQDAYGKGWLIKLKVIDKLALDALMDAAAYQAYLDAEAH